MRKLLIIFLCACTLIGCSEYRVSDDPALQLVFSCDTLSFDTVFTAQGSATAQLKLYNPNSHALEIDRVWLTDHTAFQVNVDGEADLSRLTSLQINGGDSLFVFVRVDINPLNSNSPVLVTDQLHFHLTTGKTQQVELEAFGQNVIRIGNKGKTVVDDIVFSDTVPYLISDTLIVGGPMTIKPGARLYMHRNACIIAQGDISANGSLTQPILICGDRLERLFDSVPYRYAGGGWDGIYIRTGQPKTYSFQHVDILSGNVGLSCSSSCTTALPYLTMDGCRIHNHNKYGLVLQHVNALVTNTEISNCASYCVYCEGGKHDFIHSTVASYFGYTNIRVQSVSKEEKAAVYINNSPKNPQTRTSFINSIITGYLENQLELAFPTDQLYKGAFKGNYLKTDTIGLRYASDNIYWQKTDTADVFVNDYYKYKEYNYYDFRLDSLSPAIGIGDSIASLSYPTDKNGNSRAGLKPDAGCYQYQP